MYVGPDRRKTRPSVTRSAEFTGDGRPLREASKPDSPLNRRTELPRASRHGLTTRQRQLLQALEQVGEKVQIHSP